MTSQKTRGQANGTAEKVSSGTPRKARPVLRHIVFRNLYSAREKAPPTDTEAAPEIQNQKVSFKLQKPISQFLPPHLRPTWDRLRT